MRSGFQTSLHFCCYVQEQILSYKHLDEPLDEGRFAFECILQGTSKPRLCFDLSSFTFKTGLIRTGLTDSWTHGLIPEMKIALILADMEHIINIKWASGAAVCSWESMNSGKIFCQTSMNALKKRRCCHKCCECMKCTSRGSVPQSRYMHTTSCRITELLS